MDHSADFARLDTLNFRLTPRRREVMWHIAYEPIQWAKYFHHAGSASMVVWKPIVTGSDVHSICQLLNRCRLVRWPPGSRDIWITPFGMEVLLNGIPHKEKV